MSPLEQAIRNALERADRANPDIRARIYQSARNALENGLRKQEITDAEVIGRQRERLDQTIRAIENEEADRLAAMARLEKMLIEQEPAPAPDIQPQTRDDGPSGLVPPRVAVDPVDEAGAGPMAAPGIRPASRDDVASPSAIPEVAPAVLSPVSARQMDVEHVLETAHRDEERVIADLAAGPADAPLAAHEEEDPAWAAPVTPAAARVTNARRKNRVGSAIVALFVYSVLLGSLGFGGYWVWQTGILKTLADRSGNVPELIPQVTDGDFDPASSPLDPKQSFSGDWVSVFDPEKGVSKAHEKAEVSPLSDSDGKAVRIASGSPDSRGEVEIEIPAEALADLAGKKVIFALTARSDGDQATEIYVECNFGTLGNCGRRRFPIVQDRADQLFQLDFTEKLAPSEPGRILINSDLTGGNRAIRLYGVRVLPVN